MNLMNELEKSKLIAIVRGIPEHAADQTAEALYDGGVKFIEVTMNTPGALDIIRRWKERFTGRMFIGAGTVLNRAMAEQAVQAGAEYLISPNLDEEVIAYAIQQGIEVWPGTMTPTEIVRAWNLGAKAVKVFPTGTLGLGYIKEIRAPLDHIPMIATGGVNLDNIGDFLEAGVFAVGLGSHLVNKSWIQDGNFSLIREQASKFVQAVERAVIR